MEISYSRRHQKNIEIVVSYVLRVTCYVLRATKYELRIKKAGSAGRWTGILISLLWQAYASTREFNPKFLRLR